MTCFYGDYEAEPTSEVHMCLFRRQMLFVRVVRESHECTTFSSRDAVPKSAREFWIWPCMQCLWCMLKIWQKQYRTAACKSRAFRGASFASSRGASYTVIGAAAFRLRIGFGHISIHSRPSICSIISADVSPRVIRVLIFCSNFEKTLSRVLPCLHFLTKFRYHLGPLLANGACSNVQKQHRYLFFCESRGLHPSHAPRAIARTVNRRRVHIYLQVKCTIRARAKIPLRTPDIVGKPCIRDKGLLLSQILVNLHIRCNCVPTWLPCSCLGHNLFFYASIANRTSGEYYK